MDGRELVAMFGKWKEVEENRLRGMSRDKSATRGRQQQQNLKDMLGEGGKIMEITDIVSWVSA